MGHRLSKIYTRTGDDGSTGLGDGSRTAKDSLRIEAIGVLDELNSQIGAVLAEELPPAVRACLTEVQQELFDLGGELSIPGRASLNDAVIGRLEKVLDELNAGLPWLKEFILPGGARAAAQCHVARAVCRRAERRLVALSRAEQVSATALKYLNRLSDLLFVMCRIINRHQGQADVLWQPERPAR